ncbi:MAG: hypothetical protein WCO93_04880 [bacterium]
METIVQFFASLDIFQVLINLFPGIFNPIAETIKGIFLQLWSGIESIFGHNPSIFFGILISFGIYGTYTFFQRVRKTRSVHVKK